MDTMEQQLADAAEQLGLGITDDQRTTLIAYLGQMQRWNKTYNLTAVRDPEQMLVQHIIDSLSVVRPLQDGTGGTSGTDGNINARTVADVGSGGGLPGVVLAVMCPHWQIHCIDAVEKKTAFVRQMASVLRLPNLHAVHARIEKLPSLKADIIVSRAFASLADFAALSGRHLADDGKLAAMKGRLPADEITTLEAGTQWRVEKVQTLHVPYLDAQRCLVWISRQGNL